MNYKIGDKVIHTTGGVFIISDIKIMNYGAGDIKYLCLKPYFLDLQNKTLSVFVPENKQDDLIRPVMSKEAAEALIKNMKTIEPIWLQDAKMRKEKFSELLHTGKVEDLCIIIKSLYAQQIKLNNENKSLNLMDYDYFNKIKKSIEEELSVALDIPYENITKYIVDIVEK